MKNCSRDTCKMTNPQPLDSFHKNVRAKDGHSFICKSCKKEYEDEYRKNNKDAIKVRAKIQRDKNPDYLRGWIEENKEQFAKIQKKSKDKNRQRIRKENLEYYYENRDRQLEIAKKRRDGNPLKEKAKGRKFRQENRGAINAKGARRRAKKYQATPKNLTTEDLLLIKDFYIEAARLTKETGIKYDVDHILPIQGENVTGLHVPWNLQILPRTLNIRKGNRILVEGSDLYNECEKANKFPLSHYKK